jgi:AcrR family transcriptional regulator
MLETIFEAEEPTRHEQRVASSIDSGDICHSRLVRSTVKKSRRQVRVAGAERKRIILEQAMELFSTRGFHSASIDEIAAASKITKPVLYDHFASKEDLYIQVCKEIRERLFASSAKVIKNHDVDASIRSTVEVFFKFADENPAAIRILLSPPRDEKKLYRAIQQVQDEATAAITKLYLSIGVPSPRDQIAAEQLRIQIEFVKRGMHALGQWRVEHPSVRREVVVDAISTLIRSGLPRN